MPQADRFAGLAQPDLRDQRHWPQLGAAPDNLQRGCSGLSCADHDVAAVRLSPTPTSVVSQRSQKPPKIPKDPRRPAVNYYFMPAHQFMQLTCNCDNDAFNLTAWLVRAGRAWRVRGTGGTWARRCYRWPGR